MNVCEHLTTRYGLLMLPGEVAAELRYRNAESLRASLYYWATRDDAPESIQILRSATVRRGRRAYYRTETVAEAIVCDQKQ